VIWHQGRALRAAAGNIPERPPPRDGWVPTRAGS